MKRYVLKIGRLFLCTLAFGHVAAHADINSTLIAGQFKANMEAAFNAAQAEFNHASANEAFTIFDLKLVLGFASTVGLVFDPNSIGDGLRAESIIPAKVVDALFDEKNIVAETKNDIFYVVGPLFCEAIADAGYDGFTVRLCNSIVQNNFVLVKASSEDNVSYEFEVLAGPNKDSIASISRIVSSPNGFSQAINLSGVFELLMHTASNDPELAEELKGYFSELEGAFSYTFSFSTTMQPAHCANNARTCLKFNVDKPIKAKVLESSLSINWDSSTPDAPTISFYALEDATMQIDVNNGALDVETKAGFEGSLNLGRLQGSVTIYPNDEESKRSLENPQVMISNLSLATGSTRLMISNVEIKLELNEGNIISLLKLWKDKSCFISTNGFLINADISDKRDIPNTVEHLKIEVEQSDENTPALFSCGYDESDYKPSCVRVPSVETKFWLVNVFSKLAVGKGNCVSGASMLSGSVDCSFESGVQTNGATMPLIGGNLRVNQGEILTELNNY